MITVQDIRDKYPHPRSATKDPYIEGDYCTGGACMQYAETVLGITIDPDDRDFPAILPLSNLLLKLNPALPVRRALDFAEFVVRDNDQQDYEGAWGFVEQALTYQP